jgi:hypothetical protein
VARFMALAKELARRKDHSPNGASPPADQDRKVDRDQRAETAKIAFSKRTPAIASSKRRRNWELIIGCYILLLLGVLVGSVWFFTGMAPVAGPPEPMAVNQSRSGDPPDQSDSPASPGVPEAARTSIRFAEFGCGSPVCTASCDAGERIANAFMLGADATFTYDSDRSVTVRPVRVPSNKIVLVCVPQQ